jgi:hypothetical protein
MITGNWQRKQQIALCGEVAFGTGCGACSETNYIMHEAIHDN